MYNLYSIIKETVKLTTLERGDKHFDHLKVPEQRWLTKRTDIRADIAV